MKGTPPDILDLVERFRLVEQSDTNRRRQVLWHRWPREASGPPAFPITIEPEAPMWADILGFGLIRFYQDPEEYLRRNLQMALYRFDRWGDDTPLEKRIRIWMGVNFEASLFGAETRYSDTECPWITGGALIDSEEDFDALSRPDFQTSGLMPRAHEMYRRIREMLPDDFAVDFPDWERSPFGVCNHIRGTENLLMDMVAEPRFAARQVEFMTACRKQWVARRAEFLGIELPPGVLLNDEVNGELFGPDLYEQFALPSEVAIGRFQGVTYWHSCGNATAFLPLIRRVPGLEIFHVGPRTDVDAAGREMTGLALQVCMDPMQDVQRADETHVRQRIGHIMEACRGKAFTVRADGLHTVDTLERELKAIDQWLSAASAAREEFTQAGP
ncbi:MAG: uroporphyrinogen decarboxylase family protein [Phycisphaerae bacterium]